jgi:hypothetical protein
MKQNKKYNSRTSNVMMALLVVFSISCSRYHYIPRAAMENQSCKNASIALNHISPNKLSQHGPDYISHDPQRLASTKTQVISDLQVSARPYSYQHNDNVSITKTICPVSITQPSDSTSHNTEKKSSLIRTFGLIAAGSVVGIVIGIFALNTGVGIFLLSLSVLTLSVSLVILAILILLKILNYLFGDAIPDPGTQKEKKPRKVKTVNPPKNDKIKEGSKSHSFSAFNYIFITMLFSNLLIWILSKMKMRG